MAEKMTRAFGRLMLVGAVAAGSFMIGPAGATVLAAGAGHSGAQATPGTLMLTPPAAAHAPSTTTVARYGPANTHHIHDGLGAARSTNQPAHGSTTDGHTSPSLNTASLPASVDISQYDPPVGDQGSVNSCVAWAVDYGLRGWYAKRDGYYPGGGSDGAGSFAPMYTYAQIVKGSNAGTTFDDNLNIQQSQGVDTRADYAQGDDDYTTQPTASETANAAQYKIASWAYLPGGTAEQQTIKNALAGGTPVALGIPVYSNFSLAGPNSYYVDVPPAGSNNYGNHAVLAVKYDSNGVWIENSWGIFWGLNGYAELSWAFVDGYAWAPVTLTPLAPSSAPTATATATNTSVPSSPTATNTQAPPTATATNTPVPPSPTSTNTPPPTATQAPLGITLKPNAGKAGSSSGVTGQGFKAGETVTVTWNSKSVYSGTVAANGTFTCTVSVPKNSHAGAVAVAAKGSSGDAASATFTVQ